MCGRILVASSWWHVKSLEPMTPWTFLRSITRRRAFISATDREIAPKYPLVATPEVAFVACVVATETCEDACPWNRWRITPTTFVPIGTSSCSCLLDFCQQDYYDHQSLVGQQQLPQKPWYGMEAPSWPPPKINHIAHSFLCYLFNKLSSLTFTSVKTRKVRENSRVQLPNQKASGALHSTTAVCTKLKTKASATTPQTVGRV